ncbi:hypothetical protein [Aquitalea sp. LB_tupeE]|uniref:hypothetical protein n=1 Tax=Aquitalea sp. LB_tupeE TaxID=2748078 RepID=UPI0015BC43A0|nr:hypothetical protein [Aquitalea sp. LB_tupeE]NWK78899.1 hypothetical protein [Aquitalea sp. LB_tupeE]
MNQTRPRIHSNIGFHVEIPQMLETINTQYAGQGIVATAIAGLGTERCNCGFERIPPHDIVYSSREDFATGQFLVDGLSEIGEAQQLAHRYSLRQ